MVFAPFITEAATGKRIDVEITPATLQELRQTKHGWQTDWTSDYIMDNTIDKYAVRTMDKEIVALGAYEILPESVIVHIVYMESHPESNPTISGETRKYTGIGKLLIAFGIKLSVDNGLGGEVSFEAKTSELARHYERDFGAIPLGSFGNSMAYRYLLNGESARSIFFHYLK